MLRTTLATTTTLAALLGAAPAHAVQDCEMNGERVNPAKGATYAGKPGIMKCIDLDSRKLVLVSDDEFYADGSRKSVGKPQ